ncbi:hypothetical protein HX005_08020 [Acinetobacter sp. R933-2]|uniref:DUF6988 family protein n=1 Tax=Acinetobacter sp. R933-2 TaxID=2746728 RepID=UPI002576B8F0|nr:hypothetical protein [Acinetobacter sp. R933-2]MDM1247334.1 hypothetical protein [Acinetobacter sp. R933-2]
MDLFDLSMEMINELYGELEQSYFMEGGIRLELVYQCCDLSIEHGIAVKTLLMENLVTSAMALFRIQFESVVRAYWLLMVASNQDVLKLKISSIDDLFKNHKIPMVSAMIEALSQVKEISHIIEQFRQFKFYSMNHLNNIVHSGAHSIIRRKAGLTEQQTEILIRQTNNFTTMAAQILLRHAAKEKYIHHLHEKYRPCFHMEEDVSIEEKMRIDARYK